VQKNQKITHHLLVRFRIKAGINNKTIHCMKAEPITFKGSQKKEA